jgi:hypothetical protein
VSGPPGFPAGRGRLQGGGVSEGPTTLDEKVQRLEELRAKLEACESLEEAVDLLGEFDAAAKDLIEAIDQAKREADAQP